MLPVYNAVEMPQTRSAPVTPQGADDNLVARVYDRQLLRLAHCGAPVSSSKDSKAATLGIIGKIVVAIPMFGMYWPER